MLKIYKMPNGRTYQFEEGKAPAGAIPVQKTVDAKEKKPEANKARKPKETK